MELLRVPAIMRILLLFLSLVLSLPTFAEASSSSPLAYDIILVIVILELIFAFSVGVVCILFSFNLILTLKDSSNETMNSLKIGDLPPSRISLHQRESEAGGNNGNNNNHNHHIQNSGVNNSHRASHDDLRGSATTDYKTFRDSGGRGSGAGVGTSFGSELDVERQLSDNQPRRAPNQFAELFNTFYNYIRLW